MAAREAPTRNRADAPTGTQERFQIASAEGLVIRGILEVPESPRALIVIVHGFKGFMQWGFFPWIAEQLRIDRFASCRFDMSRNGIGEVEDRIDRLDLFEGDTYSIELADLQAVVTHVHSLPELHELPLFLLGHSRGGGIALLAPQHFGSIRGIVTWSSIAIADRWDEATKRQWRRDGFMTFPNQRTGQLLKVSSGFLDDLESNRQKLDILDAAERLQSPLLVIHGTGDESVPFSEGKQLSELGASTSLMMIEGTSHTYGAIHPLVNVSPSLDIAYKVTSAFFSAYCRRW